MPSLTPEFERVAMSAGNICETDSDLLEQFVAALYCSTFDGDIKVNDARQYLSQERETSKTIDNIHLTAAALNEQVKRSVLQVYESGNNFLEATRVELEPADWGWMKDGDDFFQSGAAC
jgi:hypothetical protein